MKILKIFWSDFSNLSRFQFACKYVFPTIAAFFTWGAIVNLHESTLDKKQLLQYEGRLENMEIVFQQGTKSSYRYYPLIISLKGLNKDFRLRDALSDWFPLLQDKIKLGDTISIYTRTEFQSKIGWGVSNDIYLIEKNNDPILPTSVIADYNSKQGKISLFISLPLWTLFILYKFKIIKPQ